MIDKNAMWYKMSFAKYGSNVARWRFSANNLKDMSKVWRGIVENSLDASVVRWLGDKNFSWKIGNGKTTLFWEDKWCGKDSLKVDFPRLFRLAKLKYASVFDYSSNYGFSNVNWEDIFVRPLLDREMGILSRLIDRVSCVVMVPEVEDRILWDHEKDGEFSVKQLSKLLSKGEGEGPVFVFDKIWKLKVPPRVRIFFGYWPLIESL